MAPDMASLPPQRPAVVGVVGAGTMGAGIAQLALEHGHTTWLHDVDAAAVERGIGRIRDGLARRAAKLGGDADSIEAWVDGRLEHLRVAVSPDALAGAADLVIEAALEDLELKRALFTRLDAAAAPGTILATNTSALPVAAIAEATRAPGRVLGLHFFNPPPIMALVEIVAAPTTEPAVADRAAALVTGWGKTPVRSTDAPGFIVNRVNRAFTLEALAALERGEAGVAAIDEAVRADGFPMGPFALMDLIGIDVNLAVCRALHGGFVARGDPLAERFAPSPIQERLAADGRLGRKAGSGFYRYDDAGRAGEPALDLGPPGVRSPAGESPVADAAAIAERIRLAIDLEAWRALDEGVASAADIDVALRLGASHPAGPFEHITALGGLGELTRRVAASGGQDRSGRFDLPAGLAAAEAAETALNGGPIAASR